ncbi:MAG: hypothetical protein H0W20_14625 [Chthoniobacterales bacterium]|nr:hypothetical protein [Chthoniobacterales bacterium]
MINITELTRRPAPFVTPQSLACDGEHLWISSRDLGTYLKVDARSLEVVEEIDPPGLVWAAVLTNDGWRLTIGKGLNDDRYVYRYTPGGRFVRLFACPEFAGSYLSFDGSSLYLSRWYKGQIHRLDDSGTISRTIDIGAEICGHTFADGMLYVLRGTEENSESWSIARVDLRKETPAISDLAAVPFACRSLAFEGDKFWTNHRAAGEVVSFSLPPPI